ncbi:MAG: hypothetical protein FJX40_09010 [Alphaproteobacteria bacterium]|nr:hypothetical protein [Alphaproteobacteria bacterium]
MATLMRALATDVAAEAPAGRASFRAIVRDVLALGQKQGAVRSDQDATPLAFIVIGLFITTVLYALKIGKPVTAHQIDWLLQLVFEGIGARSALK